jgi:hypothetical protein
MDTRSSLVFNKQWQAVAEEEGLWEVLDVEGRVLFGDMP